MTEYPYKIRVKKGEIEYEVVGDKEFAVSKAKELDASLFESHRESEKGEEQLMAAIEGPDLPKTMREKLAKLRNEGFFREPRGSAEVTAEIRTRGWGIYAAKDVSKALLDAMSELKLRRSATGKNRFSYTYP
jgi:hypothetical protein